MPGYYYHMYEGCNSKNPIRWGASPSRIYPLPVYRSAGGAGVVGYFFPLLVFGL